MPRVTLMVPNYNGERFLATTLGSLLAQRYDDFAVVVVDNRSTDRSRQIASSLADERLQLVEADEHVPLVANFNRALRLADSPLFALCAADELYEPIWLPAMVELLDRFPRAFVALCRPDSVDADGRLYLAPEERYKDGFWPPIDPVPFEPARQVAALQRGNFLILTAGLFRSDATRTIGQLNERYSFVADWEYWLRGLFEGHTIVGTPRRLVHYRRHPQMASTQLARNMQRWEEELQMAHWIAEAGHRAGYLPTDQPDFGLIRNTLASHFAARLAAGESDGAREVLDFAERRVPGFGLHPIGLLLRASAPAGRLGGVSLQALSRIAIRGRGWAARFRQMIARPS